MSSFGNIKENASYEQTPAGTYPARLQQVIDLGTQVSTYGANRKFILDFEMSKRKEDGTPYRSSRWFTGSLHRKSSLRGFLESWAGRELTGNERGNFNFDTFLELSALVTIMHKADSTGELKARIISISPLPDGLEALPLANEQVVFDLADPDPTVFASIPQGLQDIIKKSPEFAASGLDAKAPPPDGGDNALAGIA